MTERNPPVWMQSGTYNAVDDRMITGMLSDRTFSSDGATSVGIEGGVIPPFDQLAVTVPGNTMTLSLSSGAVVIPSSGVSPPGAYICYNDGARSFTFDIESTGNPRFDIIYAEVSDATTGGATSAWALGVKKGAPSASPTDPTLVGSQFPLYRVRVVPAAQNGGVNKIMSTQVVDQRRFNTSQGAVHVTKGGTPNPAHSPGRLLYNIDSKFLYISDGTTWQHYLSYETWQGIFSAARPRQDAIGATHLPGADSTSEAWIHSPRLVVGVIGNSPPLQVTGMQSPSGSFKVSLSSHGRVQATDTDAFISVRALQGTTTVFEPGFGWKGLSYYVTAWQKTGTTFMIHSIPANTDTTFRVEFYKKGVDATLAYFNSTFIMVEPIL